MGRGGGLSWDRLCRDSEIVLGWCLDDVNRRSCPLILHAWSLLGGFVRLLTCLCLLSPSDLKPENILLDATGHVALCDFGLSKPDLKADQLTNTFCGTTEYLAPEVLLDDQGYSKTVDFWSLGVLLFEMCCGWSPFYDEDVQQMYKNICFGRIKFPRGVIGEDGKQFVKGVCALSLSLFWSGFRLNSACWLTFDAL